MRARKEVDRNDDEHFFTTSSSSFLTLPLSLPPPFPPNPIIRNQVQFLPSARGLKLFTVGAGDDLSGFEADNIYIFVSNSTYPSQFNDPLVKRQVVAHSAKGDPAPLVPAKGRGGEPAKVPFGHDKNITDITIAVVVKRISLYYVLGMIVPIILLAGLASKWCFILFYTAKEQNH